MNLSAKNIKLSGIAVSIILCISFFSCKHTQERAIVPAIYFWKSNFQPTAFEKNKLDSLNVQCLYIKFFDIAWNGITNAALPIAKIRISDTSYLRSKKIIPTVFITNEVMYKLDSAALEKLAKNTASLIQKYITLYRLKGIEEIQMDCDWTASTKNKYFYFLQKIKAQNPESTLSATIRMHQVKYTTSSGIPPVDKGLLMCYNMGNLQAVKTKNSIIEPDEFARYSSYVKTYPLLLDIGLPVFDWYVLFSNNKYAGLFQTIPQSFLNTCRQINKNRYEVQKDTLLLGRPLDAGDILRYESSNYNSIAKVATLLQHNLTGAAAHVVLYHCDSVILNKYSIHELEDIYGSLRNN